MSESVLRIYDPDECSADGKPLDWDHCRGCAGSGEMPTGVDVDFDTGTVDCDDVAACARCAGHGSLRAAALAHMRYGTCVDVGRLDAMDASVGREPRCEDCGHPMSDGTWEGGDGTYPNVFDYALINIRGGQDPGAGVGVHYSPCDEGCRHAGPLRWGTFANGTSWFTHESVEETPGWAPGSAVGTHLAAVRSYAGGAVEASWRPVDIRTLGWPHDLRPERLAVLCLRCFAER